jgi:hypothetical protein
VDLPAPVPTPIAAAPSPSSDEAEQAGNGLPVSLIVFAALLLAALVGIALLVTRRSSR